VIKPAYSVSFLLSINIFVWQNVLYFPNDPLSNMWKVEALFQGHTSTWCLLLRSFVSCEEDERSEGTR